MPAAPPPNLDDVVFGLVGDPAAIGDRRVTSTCRDLTLSWARFCYHGPILEAGDRDGHQDGGVDAVLARALTRGARYAFLLWYGELIRPNALPVGDGAEDFATALAHWLHRTEFLAAGTPVVREGGEDPGFARRCLTVDLGRYRELGRPPFGSGSRAGRAWIRAALGAGLPVLELGAGVRAHVTGLEPEVPLRRRALAPHLGRGLDAYDPEQPPEGLSPEQVSFLGSIRRQTSRARRAVGLWNIEPYDDIEPPGGFRGPLETVYSVSQGFKPNILLERLGFTPRTRVVFFDYSRQALEVRRYLVEHWDGDDFPRFVDQIFRTFPDPETHYYLWGGLRPHEIDGKDMERLWQRELRAWGGESVLRRHWRRYRALPHRYVCCDLLGDPTQLLDQVRGRGPAAIWWSNAFFTLYANWYFSIAERQQRYERFLAELVGRRPELCLFGSDPVNNSVNQERAASYLEQLRALRPADPGLAGLEPLRLHAVQIPM